MLQMNPASSSRMRNIGQPLRLVELNGFNISLRKLGNRVLACSREWETMQRPINASWHFGGGRSFFQNGMRVGSAKAKGTHPRASAQGVRPCRMLRDHFDR